jgi:tol-pal system protein YbgF
MMRSAASNIWQPILALLAIPLLVSSCVTVQEDIVHLNDQIVNLNRRVDALEGKVDEELSSDLEARLGVIHESQAGMRTELDRISNNLQDLVGRVENNDQLIKHAIERDTTEQDTMRSELDALADRMHAVDSRLQRVYANLGLKMPPRTAEQAEEKLQPEKQRRPKKEIPVKEEEPVSPEQQLYDESLAAYKGGNYESAIGGFRDFLKKYPDSDLKDNAQFWIGECYMGLKEYEQAILAYQEVIKRYPNGNKVPNAMLRQAVAFSEIKDNISAKLLLRKVIEKYPDSSEAQIATKKLETMQ